MNDRISTAAQSAIRSIDQASPALFLHCAIFLRGNRIVSDETFRLVSFQGQESTSDLFEFELELHGNTSHFHGAPFSFDQVVGRPLTVGIQYPSEYSQQEMAERFQRAVRGAQLGPEMALFNGIVSSFSLEIQGVYRISMKPALHKLSLTNQYRIHSQKNVRDVIGDLLDSHRIAYSMEAVAGIDNPAIARIQDWLQAGETDLEFLKRMMGKAHLYYYFSHSGNQHKIVFANRAAYPPVFASRKALRYTYTATDDVGLAQSDVVSQYSYQKSLCSSGVRGTFTRQEAAWEADPVAQFQAFQAFAPPDTGKLPFRQSKVYQYGCSIEEIRHFTDATSDALASAASQFSGSSYCAHFRVGHQFSLTGSELVDCHPTPVRPSLEGQHFVLTMVKHQASADGGYSNQFQATEAQGTIAAYSIQETQQGSVLARVVAKAGTAAPQDWRYYTAVAPFDPESNSLTDTQGTQIKLKAIGVYVCFATDGAEAEPVWVKLAPHMQTVPEIGVTVLVSRAQDESELPEIQSIIQSNGSMVIMPSSWSANSHVGSSYSTSYGDGKSIRYGKNSSAALPKAVGIVSSAYDSGQYRDTSYSQGASYSFSSAESSAASATPDASELYGPYAGAADILSASESFGSNYSRQHAAVSSSFSKIGTSYSKSSITESMSIGQIGSSDSTQDTGTATSTSTTGSSTNTSTTGLSDNISATGISNSLSSTGISTSAAVTGVSAQASVTGISSSSNLTGISASTSTTGISDAVNVTGVSTSTSLTGISSNDAITGISTGNSLTGVSTNNSLTGVNTNSAITGVSSSLNVTGVTSSINISGTSTVMTVTGTNNTIDMIGPGFKYTDQALQPHIENVDLRLTMITILQVFM